MNWSDERFVRVYTRDTVTWKCLSWDAKSVLLALIRKVDRAGVLDFGGHGFKGVAVAIDAPLEVVHKGLPELADKDIGSIELYADRLVIPNFMEAQEAVMSDRLRQAESRARRRDAARLAVTGRDNMSSRDVTPRHGNGQNITPGHAVSLLPILSDPSDPSDPSEDPPIVPQGGLLPERSEEAPLTGDLSPDRGAVEATSQPTLFPESSAKNTAPGSKSKASAKSTAKRANGHTGIPEQAFLDLFELYPKRKTKAVGLAKLRQAIKSPEEYERVKHGIESYAAECRRKHTEEKYIANFSTFVHQRRWEDYENSPQARGLDAVSEMNRLTLEDERKQLERLRREGPIGGVP